MAVGLGAADTGFTEFGEETNMKVRAFVEQQGCDESYDIVVEGTTPGDDSVKAQEEVRKWQDAGAT